MDEQNLDQSKEDKILLERESLKYEEKINKKKIRKIMYNIKVEGYNQIELENKIENNLENYENIYLKIFMGYITEIKALGNVSLVDSLIDSIVKKDFIKKIEKILKNRIKNIKEIEEILKN